MLEVSQSAEASITAAIPAGVMTAGLASEDLGDRISAVRSV